jgi:hypothetical protein
LGNNFLFMKENDKLLTLLASYLGDACPEVRGQAKNGFLELTQAIMGKNDLERLLQRFLSEVHYKKVKDFLDNNQYQAENNTGGFQPQSDFLITNAAHPGNAKITKVTGAAAAKAKAASLNSGGQLRSSALGSATSVRGMNS